jgi:hypothetical protein
MTEVRPDVWVSGPIPRVDGGSPSPVDILWVRPAHGPALVR